MFSICSCVFFRKCRLSYKIDKTVSATQFCTVLNVRGGILTANVVCIAYILLIRSLISHSFSAPIAVQPLRHFPSRWSEEIRGFRFDSKFIDFICVQMLQIYCVYENKKGASYLIYSIPRGIIRFGANKRK